MGARGPRAYAGGPEGEAPGAVPAAGGVAGALVAACTGAAGVGPNSAVIR